MSDSDSKNSDPKNSAAGNPVKDDIWSDKTAPEKSAQEESAQKKPGHDDVPPIPPSLPAAEAPRHGGRIFLFGALAVVALLAAAVALVMLQPQLRDRALARLDPGAGLRADLAARVLRLDGEIAALKNRPQSAPGVDPAAVDVLARKLAALEAALSDFQNRPLPEVPRAAVDDGATSLLALIAALDSGRPFAPMLVPARAALARLARSADRLAALDAIAAQAAAGVPTAAQLAARATALDLSVAAPDSAQGTARDTTTNTTAPTSGGLWERIKARLGGLVTIRRVDEAAKAAATPAAPKAPDAAAASALFARGDVAGARARLATVKVDSLTPAQRAALASLVADADARLAADRVATGPVMAPPGLSR